MKSFWELIYDSFLRVNGWLFGGLALILGIGVLFLTPDTKVSIGWPVMISALSAVVIAILIDACHISWKASRRGLPAVIRALEPPATYQEIIKILIVESSDLFSADALVSIYINDDEYERLVGIGRVLTIQTNGYLQIGILTITETSGDLSDRLGRNDSTVLKKLLVKPSVPSFLVQER